MDCSFTTLNRSEGHCLLDRHALRASGRATRPAYRDGITSPPARVASDCQTAGSISSEKVLDRAVAHGGVDHARVAALRRGVNLAVGAILDAAQRIAHGDLRRFAHGDPVVGRGVRRILRREARRAHRPERPRAAGVEAAVEAENFANHHGVGGAVGDVADSRALAVAHLPRAAHGCVALGLDDVLPAVEHDDAELRRRWPGR